MSIAVYLKNNLKNISPGLGAIMNKIPYSKRPGLSSIYNLRRKDIISFNLYSIEEKKDFIFSRMKAIVGHAYNNVPFYKEYYDEHNFHPTDLNSFGDITLIPIVDKSILNQYEIEKRSTIRSGRYLVNTGGSSGTPFSLYIESSSMGHEWAHMHYIWEKLGYRPSDLKIVFGGRSDLKKAVEYDVVRNHFAVNIYADYKLVAEHLKIILIKYKIKYLHGYPTSIYDFANYCEENDIELRELISKNLKGIFLGSEYPFPHYREMIERTFNCETISWYGHTERAVLAYEKNEKFIYEPFATYGFAEALQIDNENFNLIATSYYNFASPLIRYNTQDIISNIEMEGYAILKSFKVSKGRDGEFVLDKDSKKISLTGLIFGRHHEIFNYSKFIQIKQIDTGKVEVHFVSDSLTKEGANKLFDQKNLNLDISFVKRTEPVKSSSGKVNLLIK